MPSGLQERIARILAELPEARDFALAGGAVLIATRLVSRRTKDLDIFTERPEAVLELLPLLEEIPEQALEVADRQMAREILAWAVREWARILGPEGG